MKFLTHPQIETRISHTAKNRNCAVSLVRNVDIAPFTALDFFSPFSTVSMFVSFEQKIECSPLLVTNVKKEITSA
jgi:hypothetical protein